MASAQHVGSRASPLWSSGFYGSRGGRAKKRKGSQQLEVRSACGAHAWSVRDAENVREEEMERRRVIDARGIVLAKLCTPSEHARHGAPMLMDTFCSRACTMNSLR